MKHYERSKLTQTQLPLLLLGPGGLAQGPPHRPYSSLHKHGRTPWNDWLYHFLLSFGLPPSTFTTGPRVSAIFPKGLNWKAQIPSCPPSAIACFTQENSLLVWFKEILSLPYLQPSLLKMASSILILIQDSLWLIKTEKYGVRVVTLLPMWFRFSQVDFFTLFWHSGRVKDQ